MSQCTKPAAQIDNGGDVNAQPIQVSVPSEPTQPSQPTNLSKANQISSVPTLPANPPNPVTTTRFNQIRDAFMDSMTSAILRCHDKHPDSSSHYAERAVFQALGHDTSKEDFVDAESGSYSEEVNEYRIRHIMRGRDAIRALRIKAVYTQVQSEFPKYSDQQVLIHLTDRLNGLFVPTPSPPPVSPVMKVPEDSVKSSNVNEHSTVLNEHSKSSVSTSNSIEPVRRSMSPPSSVGSMESNQSIIGNKSGTKKGVQRPRVKMSKRRQQKRIVRSELQKRTGDQTPGFDGFDGFVDGQQFGQGYLTQKDIVMTKLNMQKQSIDPIQDWEQELQLKKMQSVHGKKRTTYDGKDGNQPKKKKRRTKAKKRSRKRVKQTRRGLGGLGGGNLNSDNCSTDMEDSDLGSRSTSTNSSRRQ